MWRRTEIATDAKSQLTLVIQSKAENLIIQRLQYSMCRSTFHDLYTLALQRHMRFKIGFQFALPMLSISALSVLISSEADYFILLGDLTKHYDSGVLESTGDLKYF